MHDEMKNGKKIGIRTVLGQENLKVTCVERKYKVSNSKIGFFVIAKKELDENTTQELLHEDMELKTFLANYEITDVAPASTRPESTDISGKNLPAGKMPITNTNVKKNGAMKQNPKSEAVRRMGLFDSLNLPERFLIKDYKNALEEIGIKSTNTAMPYDDLERLEKQGKIARIGKGEKGAVSFLKKKKEEAIVMQ